MVLCYYRTDSRKRNITNHYFFGNTSEQRLFGLVYRKIPKILIYFHYFFFTNDISENVLCLMKFAHINIMGEVQT